MLLSGLELKVRGLGLRGCNEYHWTSGRIAFWRSLCLSVLYIYICGLYRNIYIYMYAKYIDMCVYVHVNPRAFGCFEPFGLGFPSHVCTFDSRFGLGFPSHVCTFDSRFQICLRHTCQREPCQACSQAKGVLRIEASNSPHMPLWA